MSLTPARRGLSSLHGLSRQYSTGKKSLPGSSSTASSSNVPSHTTLPPAKMRALIALYHQADSWITPDNLAEKIDQAFVPKRASSLNNVLDPGHNIFQGRIQLSDLQKAKHNMDVAPKIAQWDRNQTVDTSANTNWSRNGSNRELKVIEALYGVTASATTGQLSPGLQVVQEAARSGLLSKEDFERDSSIFEKEEDSVKDLQPTGQNPS